MLPPGFERKPEPYFGMTAEELEATGLDRLPPYSIKITGLQEAALILRHAGMISLGACLLTQGVSPTTIRDARQQHEPLYACDAETGTISPSPWLVTAVGATDRLEGSTRTALSTGVSAIALADAIESARSFGVGQVTWFDNTSLHTSTVKPRDPLQLPHDGLNMALMDISVTAIHDNPQYQGPAGMRIVSVVTTYQGGTMSERSIASNVMEFPKGVQVVFGSRYDHHIPMKHANHTITRGQIFGSHAQNMAKAASLLFVASSALNQ